MQQPQQHNSALAIPDLVSALRQRIDDDTALLSRILKYWSGTPERAALQTLDDLIPVDDIERATDGKITKSSARWMARNRNENGMADAFVVIGKRLFINLPVLTRLIAKTR
jgi:hypothetical protein